MAELKIYTSLIPLFQDIVNGLTGIVVQANDSSNLFYFVVQDYDETVFQMKRPNSRDFVNLGMAKDGEFVGNFELGRKLAGEFDYHNYAEEILVCESCGRRHKLDYINVDPVDRVNVIWEGFVAHQKTNCKRISFRILIPKI